MNLVLMLALPGMPARSAQLETLLMPGPLSTAHAKLENNCASCHDRSDRSRQAALCADCHKPILEDLRAHTGFHGRLPGNGAAQCSACHQEHQGRGADIVKFVPEQFDHARTDFALQGAHAVLTCVGCHEAGKAWRTAPSRCNDCHRRDDPHAGHLGTDCAACHDSRAWMQTRFDHATTRFALTGGHASVACAACHIDRQYARTPMQCASCHAPDDIHRGTRGTQCGDCHTTAGWKNSRFDHATTGFALSGSHAQAACSSCHRSGRMDEKLPTQCDACHRADDQHAGRMGPQCDTCHGTQRWSQTIFDHARDARFRLSGAHARLACASCHTASQTEQKLTADCHGCHTAADVHLGQLGTRCDTCHTETSWREVQFDHELTDFPLLGMHAVVPCESCHLTPAFKDASRECYSCHRTQDRHDGGLGPRCESCHSPDDWAIWDFDHAATGFALSGAHARVGCGDCHRRPPSQVRLPGDCYSCHSRDDPHLGQYGRECQRCHSTISFRKVRLR